MADEKLNSPPPTDATTTVPEPIFPQASPNGEAGPGQIPNATNSAAPATSAHTPPSTWQLIKQSLFGQPKKTSAKTGKEPSHRADPVHESLETVVFVVFLVVLLKAFVAEAFVIPTGSMATTLLGYNRTASCDKCGWQFPVNASDETEVGHRHTGPITQAMCPHCGHVVRLTSNYGPDGGDKVLVFKPAYDIGAPERFNVIVFKFPGQPQEQFIAKNYIKRLWGLPGEKLAIWYGDVYLVDAQGQLQMLRKPPAQQLEMRRIVYHNDYQRSELKGIVPPRWADEGNPTAWTVSDDGKVFAIQPADRESWLRYRHIYHSTTDELLRKLQEAESQRINERNPKPGLEDEIKQLREELSAARLITDTVGYNTYKADETFNWQPQSWNWVHDLMIECDVVVAEPAGEMTLELVVGVDKHQAVFDLATGNCTLRVLRDGKMVKESSVGTSLKKAGKFHLRFSNFDERLTLWVDSSRPFGDGMEFPGQAEEQRGPRVADLRPAGIGAKNATLKIQHLQLWRDIYYTRWVTNRTPELSEPITDAKIALTADELKLLGNNPNEIPVKWQVYHNHRPQHYDVNPGQYFALGDNSTQSADSRDWGGVPERLLLGKAVFVYWPLPRFGPIW
jgi:signal peptidase I